MMRTALPILLLVAACDDREAAPPRSPRAIDPALTLAIIVSAGEKTVGVSTAIDPVEPRRDEAWFRNHLAQIGPSTPVLEVVAIEEGFDARVEVLGRNHHLVYRTVGGRGFTCQTLGDSAEETDLLRRQCLAFFLAGDRLVIPFALGADTMFADHDGLALNIARAEPRDPADAAAALAAHDPRVLARRSLPGGGSAVLFEARDEPEHHRYHAYLRRTLAGIDVVCSDDGKDLAHIRRSFEVCLTLHEPRGP